MFTFLFGFLIVFPFYLANFCSFDDFLYISLLVIQCVHTRSRDIISGCISQDAIWFVRNRLEVERVFLTCAHIHPLGVGWDVVFNM